jgi:D-beta-D-heptose 7-phosphate kinase/D-beta-D-heptose 1-phosphate adenosyltransferase
MSTRTIAHQPRILVVGDIMLDRYVIGNVSRISPEAPVPVLAAVRDDNRPGGAANVAANIVAMEGDATILAVVGEDDASIELTRLLHSLGVSTSFIADPQGQTTEKTRLVVGSQQIARVDRDVQLRHEMQERLLAAFREQASDYDLIVFSDYAKGSLDRLPEFVAVANELKIPTLIDPKRTAPEFYRGTHLLKPNNSEFISLFGPYSSDEQFVELARKAVVDLGLQHLVVTRGALGMVVISAGGTARFIPTYARDVFDVSGAGDTVLAALAVDLVLGHDVAAAALKANVAAGIAVSHPGTYVVSRKEIEIEQLSESLTEGKIVDETELAAALRYNRQHGRRIVFTNGCFDILHPGHVRLLRAARQLGDVLVLGLNSDASIRQLKGAGRPINSFSHRAEVLEGLSSVDYIIEFDAPTPIDLISAVVPDVLVKGGDYEPSTIVGYDVVTEAGGQVVALDFHEGYSTTKIINEINVRKADDERQRNL